MTELIIGILKNTAMITGFVMVMMLLIEYINVKTHGTFSQALTTKPHLQILLATVLGLIPGCLGTFTVVSLFTHRILSFGALVAALIASSGDEAFFMISMMPQQTVWITAILGATAIIFGYGVDFILKGRIIGKYEGHFVIHEHESHAHSPELARPKTFLNELRTISFHRALLLFGILTFIVTMSLGMLAHSHGPAAAHDDAHSLQEAAHAPHAGHDESCDSHHDAVAEQHESHAGHLGWMEYTFIAVSILTLFMVSTVSDHFLEEHLWTHILRKHFLRILLWTLGALVLATAVMHFVHLPEYSTAMLWGMLAMAILIGIVPESGPHMVFISLYLSGSIPLSIVVASSIVQDGHGAIPLFAESPKHFVIAKLINIAAGLAVGGTMLYWGY